MAAPRGPKGALFCHPEGPFFAIAVGLHSPSWPRYNAVRRWQ